MFKEKISEVFGEVPHRKVLVVWDIKDDSIIPYAKETYGIEIWKIQELLQELGKHVSGSRDDVLRLAELFYYSKTELSPREVKYPAKLRPPSYQKCLKKLRKERKERRKGSSQAERGI